MESQVKHYTYRLDHDTGFAPHVCGGICTLSGCKANIERCAQGGSWVIGVGGNNTRNPDKLIYAMQVEENICGRQFSANYKAVIESEYLTRIISSKNVLVSKKFYYFGENALKLPKRLEDIIHKGRNCKCVFLDKIKKLEQYLRKNYVYGVHGKPNNFEGKWQFGYNSAMKCRGGE